MIRQEATIRCYELPQKKYSLWYTVGEQLGPLVQAAVMTAFEKGDNVVYLPNHSTWAEHDLRQMAIARGISLTIR